MDKQELRQALHRNNLSCDQFASLLGRSVSQIYTWGERYPVPYYARIFLRLLDERGGHHGLLQYIPKQDSSAVKTEKSTETVKIHRKINGNR